MGLNPVTRRLYPELARQEARQLHAVLAALNERVERRKRRERAERRMYRELGDDFRLTNLPDDPEG